MTFLYQLMMVQLACFVLFVPCFSVDIILTNFITLKFWRSCHCGACKRETFKISNFQYYYHMECKGEGYVRPCLFLLRLFLSTCFSARGPSCMFTLYTLRTLSCGLVQWALWDWRGGNHRIPGTARICYQRILVLTVETNKMRSVLSILVWSKRPTVAYSR